MVMLQLRDILPSKTVRGGWQIGFSGPWLFSHLPPSARGIGGSICFNHIWTVTSCEKIGRARVMEVLDRNRAMLERDRQGLEFLFGFSFGAVGLV